VCKYKKQRNKLREKNINAGFKDAYFSDHVTCEDESAENVILDGHM
jgi:hypothetical protein